MTADYRLILWISCYAVVMMGLCLYGFHRYSILYHYFKHRHDPPKPKGRFDELPKVTVQLPIYNEYHVVDRLLDAVAALDYPSDRLEVQVLDDSTDETWKLNSDKVDSLRKKGLDIHLIRREKRTGFKAGALDEGMRVASGEFILILDADFIPGPEMIRDTIHHFTDPEIGMVQTRWGHINRNYSLLTRVQAMFLDGHLLLEQTSRSRSGKFFNFNGTAGIWRKSCISEAGGWEHDTLTEDLDLSYRAQLVGWKFVFLTDVVTPAELPVEMNGFKSQQHRWAKGSIQTCKKVLPRIWKSDLPMDVKLEATAHLTSNFTYLLLAFLCLLLHPALRGPDTGLWMGALINIPIFAVASMSAIIFYMSASRELSPDAWKRDLLLLPMLLAVGIGLSINNARAVLEAMAGHESEFTRTPKYGIITKRQTWRTGRYLPIKSVLTLLEVAFAGLFAYFIVIALLNGHYLSVPFLALFFVGFSYVAGYSVMQMLPNPFVRRQDVAEPVLA